MSFWTDYRDAVKKRTTSAVTARAVYKMVAFPGLNMLYVIKPTFYMGQLSTLTADYIAYVEKFLDTDERDWGEYLIYLLHIREISESLLYNVEKLGPSLDLLIKASEEFLEGERAEPGAEYEYEAEPELYEDEEIDSEKVKEILKDDDNETSEDLNDVEIIPEQPVSRDAMIGDFEDLKKKLTEKFKEIDIPKGMVEKFLGSSEHVGERLAEKIALVYLEAIQYARELKRLSEYPEGDLSTLMSILIDVNYGLCDQMKNHIREDVVVDNEFSFEPGLLTWSSHLLAHFSEKINEKL